MKDVVSDSTDTRNESKLRPEEASAPKISKRGISAMQGKMSPVDTPKLNHSELRDVEVRSARHLKTPAVNDRENTNKMKAYEHKLQGEMGEESMRKLGAESLNDYKGNFPVYDFISKDEVASVKTHMPSEKYKTSHLSNYAHDFRVAMGTTVAKKGVYAGKTSTSFAADALNQLSQRPEGWERISPGRMETEIKEKATLRIPSDHVEPVQNYVRRAALRYPEKYGFDHLPDNEELNQLTNRIKPLPIDSKQIQDRVQTRMQGLTQSMSL
jgi:muconolactone delta-isomerase